jgi:hypothetical protein
MARSGGWFFWFDEYKLVYELTQLSLAIFEKKCGIIVIYNIVIYNYYRVTASIYCSLLPFLNSTARWHVLLLWQHTCVPEYNTYANTLFVYQKQIRT